MMRIFVVALLPVLALQWLDVGHMLTAAIAEIRLNTLSPFAANKFKGVVLAINDLVDTRSRTFVESACWPDDLKDKQYNMLLWNDWHFLDKYHPPIYSDPMSATGCSR
jgi:hypothetical protein